LFILAISYPDVKVTRFETPGKREFFFRLLCFIIGYVGEFAGKSHFDTPPMLNLKKLTQNG
jgi:hypothetical protein